MENIPADWIRWLIFQPNGVITKTTGDQSRLIIIKSGPVTVYFWFYPPLSPIAKTRMESVVRSSHPIGSLILTCLVLLTFCCGPGQTEGANPVKRLFPRKRTVSQQDLKLTRQKGPWMIMVASFSEPPKERKSEGMTPLEAAQTLAKELYQEKGIPAFIFNPHQVGDKIKVVKHEEKVLQNNPGLQHLVKEGTVCVLAGNYDISSDSNINGRPKAEKTLKAIKKFHPSFLSDTLVESQAPLPGSTRDTGLFKKLKNGGVFSTSPGNPGPLSGAFLTINPLLSPEEVTQFKDEKLLKKLNSGQEYSLLNNKGKYTLIVATFHGKSLTQTTTGGTNLLGKKKDIDVSDGLDKAALNAWQFCHALRNAREYGYDENYEAYVFHDKYRSYVTIGSFQTPNDPRILELQQLTQAKIQQVNGRQTQFGEMFQIPRNVRPGQAPQKKWLFDPQPRLEEVPRLH